MHNKFELMDSDGAQLLPKVEPGEVFLDPLCTLKLHRILAPNFNIFAIKTLFPYDFDLSRKLLFG